MLLEVDLSLTRITMYMMSSDLLSFMIAGELGGLVDGGLPGYYSAGGVGVFVTRPGSLSSFGVDSEEKIYDRFGIDGRSLFL